MKKLDNLLTDRVAVAALLSLFTATVIALSAYRTLYNGGYEGWVIYPLMQLAYNGWLFLALFAITAFAVSRWVGRRVYDASEHKRWLAQSVVGFLVALSVLGGLAYAVMSWGAVGWTVSSAESERVGSSVYKATMARWGDDTPYAELIVMRCDFTGILCEYLTSAEARPRHAFSPLRHRLEYDPTTDSVQLWDGNQLLRYIPDVSRHEPQPIRLPQLEPITAANAARLQVVAALGAPDVGQIAWSPDGSMLAAGIVDVEGVRPTQAEESTYKTPAVIVYPTEAMHQPVLLVGDSDHWWYGRVPRVEFTGDSRYVTLSGDNPFVSIWDVETGEIVKHWQAGIAFSSKMVTVNPQTNELALAATEDAAIYQLPGMTPVTEYDAPNINLHGEYRAMAYSPDGGYLSVVGQSLVLWDVTEPRLPRVLDRLYNLDDTITTSVGPRSFVDVAFSADGKTLAAVRNQIVLYDVASGKRTGVLGDASKMVSTVAFHPGGALIASNHWTPDPSHTPEVYLWSVAEEHLIVTLLGHDMDVRSLAFHPDGTLLATASADGTVRVWGVPAA